MKNCIKEISVKTVVNIKLALLTAMALQMPTTLFATEGTRGGGVAVETDGKLELRDFVDNTVCHWVTANDFARQFTPAIRGIIQNIDSVHWALAEGFREEMSALRVCGVEGDLKQINVDDKDGVTVFLKDQRQAAIRWDDRIWIDMRVFRDLPPDHQVGLVVHEIAHSFIPMDTPMRNNSLRGFVSFLAGTFGRDSMAINIKEDNVAFTPTTDELPFTKAEYFRMKDAQASIVERYNIARRLKMVELRSSPGVYKAKPTYAFLPSAKKTWESLKFQTYAETAVTTYGTLVNALIDGAVAKRSSAMLTSAIQTYQLRESDTFHVPSGLPKSLFELSVMAGDETLINRYFPVGGKAADVNPTIFEKATMPNFGETGYEARNLRIERTFERLSTEPTFIANVRKFTQIPVPLSTDPTHQRIVQKLCEMTGTSSVQCKIEKFKNRRLVQ